MIQNAGHWKLHDLKMQDVKMTDQVGRREMRDKSVKKISHCSSTVFLSYVEKVTTEE